MNELIGIIVLGMLGVLFIIQAIFRMKYKKEMYIEFLKHYEDGTSLLSDKIMEKLFNIEEIK